MLTVRPQREQYSSNVSSPVKKVYRLLVQNIEQHNLLPTGHVKNWASAVKNILESHGFGFVWQQQNVPNTNSFLSMFNERIDDMYLQQSHANRDVGFSKGR